MKHQAFCFKLRSWIPFVFMMLFALSVSAQNMTIRGKVIDQRKESVIGANVIVKGTTNGTITDVDGNFRLEAPGNATLHVSFVGYTPVDVAANNRTFITIQLTEDAVALNEVVAIGYGSVRKSDATGSVIAIKADELTRGVATSPQELLMGKTPGVVVTTGGGAPGTGATIRIRGGSSLTASNDPLIVIDGVPVDNSGISGVSNPLSTVHPNDIESFTVLKDASATAIYGSRASNGVILITTKRGATGLTGGQKYRVQYDGNIRVNTALETVGVLSGDQFRAQFSKQWDGKVDPSSILGNANTQWQDEIFRTSISTDHNVSVAGNFGKNLPYRFSGAWTKDDGILETSSLERTTLTAVFTPTFFDEHLRINANVKGMYIKNRFANQGAIGSAISFDPTQSVYSDNHGTGIGNGYFSWVKPNDGTFIDVAGINPVAMLRERRDIGEAYRSLGNLQLDYKMHFLPDLKANLNLGYDISKSEGSNYIGDNSPMSWNSNDKKGIGERGRYDQMKKNLLLDFFFNYNKEIKSIRSRVDAVAGYSWQHFHREENNSTVTNEGKEFIRTDYSSEYFLVSLFGRVNYSFMDRYMLTLTMRNDHSSRFAKENRSGLFPSAAFAWRMIDENFMKEQSTLSDMKFRMSYGVTGQQDIFGDYPYLPRYTAGNGYVEYPFGGGVVNTVRPEGYDPNIKWEETRTYNIGIDYGFMDQRISGSIDIYQRDTKDLLNKIPVAAGSNLTNEITTNVGSMTNRGLEFAINTKPIMNKNFMWDLGFNLTYNKNEITKLNRGDDPNYFVPTGGIQGGTGNTVQAHKVGHPAYSYLVYEQVYDKAGAPIEGMYVDRNRDGRIDENDMYLSGNPAPVVSLGITSKMIYKNWDFSFNLRSNMGQKVYDNVEAGGTILAGTYISTGYTNNLLNRGTYFENAQYMSDHYVRNASFIRCDNITLGYNFDNIKRIGNLRVYSTVQNPFILTKYAGLDPEIYGGIDNNIYPRPFSVMVGASVSF